MRSDLLLYLCDEAEKNLPDEQFDMRNWFIKGETCGTVCCMMGFGASLPRLQQEGLELKLNEFGDYIGGTIHYGSLRGINAIKTLFGITETEAYHLFFPDTYFVSHITKQMVIERIRNLVGERCAK